MPEKHLTNQYDNHPNHPCEQPSGILEGILSVLRGLFTKTPPKKEDITNIKNELPAEFQNDIDKISNGTLDPNNKNRLKRKLLEKLKEQTISFKEISNQNGKIIYADPRDPSNPDKMITYQWNSSLNKWEITPGKLSSAIIVIPEQDQLLQITNGASTAYNESSKDVIIIKPPYNSKENFMESYKKTAKAAHTELINSVQSTDLKGNFISLATINSTDSVKFNELLQQFTSQECDRTRSIIMRQLSSCSDNSLVPLELSSPYEEDSYKYFWYNAGDNVIGIRINNNSGTIEPIIPENYNASQDISAMLFLDWLEGTTKDGQAHPREGFSGGYVLKIEQNGKSKLYKSARHPQSEHLIPTKPALQPAIRFTAAEIERHIKQAKYAGQQVVLSSTTNESSVSTQKPTRLETPRPAITTPPTRQPLPVVSSISGLEPHTRSTVDLPTNITSSPNITPGSLIPRVTTPDGTEFTLRCEFDRPPLDSNEEKQQARIYVFTYPGTGIEAGSRGNFTIPGGIIVEVDNSGKARIRASYSEKERKSTEMHAKVSFNGEQADIQNIGASISNVKISYNSGGAFIDNGEDAYFMCARGCCGHYGSDNIELMRNGQVKSTLDCSQRSLLATAREVSIAA